MPINKELLEVLACPACRGDISLDEKHNTLNCNLCRRRYPIRDGIPVMLIDEATIPNELENQ